MKIKQDTTARLVLDDRPLLLGGILTLIILVLSAVGLSRLLNGGPGGILSLFAAAMFGVAFAVFLRRTLVIFDRSAGTILLREGTLRGTTERHIALNRVRYAGVETRPARKSRRRRRPPMHRPVLHLIGDPEVVIPLNAVFIAGPASREAADAINRWLGVPPVPREEDA